MESAGPDCIIPGQRRPIRVLGLQVIHLPSASLLHAQVISALRFIVQDLYSNFHHFIFCSFYVLGSPFK